MSQVMQGLYTSLGMRPARAAGLCYNLTVCTILTVADLDPLDLASESIEMLCKHATQLWETACVSRRPGKRCTV